MKEFVEKMIGRLCELADEERIECDKYVKMGLNDFVVKYNHGEFCYVNAQHIVNQLAEEYKECALCYFGSPCEYQNKDAILPVELLKDENGWISVEDALPEENGWYLVTNRLGVVQQQHWGAKHWQKLEDDFVVAWMKMPAPYKKGE